MTKYFDIAIKNVTNFGDTDVFPFPIENRMFFDCPKETRQLLTEIHANFDEYIEQWTPTNYSALCPVGYSGFRWATQIEPIWNLYFLALVLKISEDIEQNRIQAARNVIHSYRVNLNSPDGQIFSSDYNWASFQRSSLERLVEGGYVLVCDISDFYPRIYHHSLENALKRASEDTESTRRIRRILQKVSNLNSYGLPVGGPASRILSELVLNKTDRLLQYESFSFLRYADDYHIFTKSLEEAYEALIFLSKKLYENEGLSLQKQKTRIISSEEFRQNSEWFSGEENGATVDQKKRFMSLSIRFDPYSPTAEEDYETLKQQMQEFDIVGMLASELKKSRVHSPIMKRLLPSIKHLDQKQKEQAIESLLENLQVLTPIFPLTCILLTSVFGELSVEIQKKLIGFFSNLIRSRSHLVRVDLNLHYVVRLIGQMRTEESEEVLNEIYRSSSTPALKRDIVLIFTKWKQMDWLSDKRSAYPNWSVWEKRAFLIASYSLEDEGSHWRRHHKDGLSSIDQLYLSWAGQIFQAKGGLGTAI